MRKEGKETGLGTGFIAISKRGPVLVTNYHNLTGLRPDTGQPIGPSPDEVEILHILKHDRHSTTWGPHVEPLYNADGRLWVEHPKLGSRCDVVALPLTRLKGVTLFPYDLNPKACGSTIASGPPEMVSVIGFPFGRTAGGALPIWATGFVASELEVDFDDLPVFLVDCRARPGQSGSPVIAYRSNGYFTQQGMHVWADPAWRFLGIYSGRIHKESDLGMVWKADVIRDVVNAVV